MFYDYEKNETKANEIEVDNNSPSYDLLCALEELHDKIKKLLKKT